MPELKTNPCNAVEMTFLLPYYRSLELYSKFDAINETISMLHPDVLTLLYHLARHSTGTILEIGSYIGGSTVAISMGIRDSGNSTKFISVERGGAQEHPQYGSKDIISDWKSNIKKWNVEGISQLIIGHSRDADIASRVKSAIGSEGLGLLFIDADGEIDKDFQIYGSLLRSGTCLVMDDYFANDEWTVDLKTRPTKRTLDEMERNNEVECLGVYGWGTWVGRVK